MLFFRVADEVIIELFWGFWGFSYFYQVRKNIFEKNPIQKFWDTPLGTSVFVTGKKELKSDYCNKILYFFANP